MNFAALRNHAAPALFFAILLGLPLSSSACGRTACFSWSAGEGACPAQKDALRFFTDPKCPGNVLSVDSEGSADFEGRLCCYAVTQNDIHFDENLSGVCGTGAGNSSGSVSPGSGGAQGTGGFGSSTSSFAVSTSAGVGGDTAPCLHCADVMDSPIPPDGVFCSDASKLLFSEYSDCVCIGPCAPACNSNACAGLDPSADCAPCESEVVGGCGDLLEKCASDH